MTIKEMLPQMKQHLADGDAAFERRPRLIEPLIAYESLLLVTGPYLYTHAP
jgi:hypothetical protein